MKLKIVQAGDPVLRRPAQPLSPEEIESPATRQLIELMRETMRDAPGVGLAAPQIGVPLRLAVVEDCPEYTRDTPPEALAERERSPVPFHVLINPIITASAGPEVEFFEGCLSLSGFSALVPRAATVRVECLDWRGEAMVIEARGWYARILQHEIDHLDGTLYLDRMRTRTLTTAENLRRFWSEKSVAEVLQELSGHNS